MATNTTTTRNKRRASGAGLTNEQNAESGFRASQKLSENTQKVLVDLIELSIETVILRASVDTTLIRV